MRSIAGGRAVASASESIDIALKIFILETLYCNVLKEKILYQKHPPKDIGKLLFRKTTAEKSL